jgi:WhiB family transcriptional regulator, redox-sensing transcriptional regulator
MPEVISTDSRPAWLLSIAIPVLGDWHGLGLCVGEDPDAFFPSHGDPGAQARQICAACVVREECLDYSAGADEFGIWGGLDQQERRNVRRQRRRRRLTGAPNAARIEEST